MRWLTPIILIVVLLTAACGHDPGGKDKIAVIDWDKAFSSDSPRQSDGAKLAVRATHTPLAEGDYVHSNTSDDNVWAFSYPEVESTRDPLLNTAPVAYDFNK